MDSVEPLPSSSEARNSPFSTRRRNASTTGAESWVPENSFIEFRFSQSGISFKIFRYVSSLALTYPANRFSIAERLCSGEPINKSQSLWKLFCRSPEQTVSIKKKINDAHNKYSVFCSPWFYMILYNYDFLKTVFDMIQRPAFLNGFFMSIQIQ